MPKFTIKDVQKQIDEILERPKRPTGLGERLREVMGRRTIQRPKMPRV